MEAGLVVYDVARGVAGECFQLMCGLAKPTEPSNEAGRGTVDVRLDRAHRGQVLDGGEDASIRSFGTKRTWSIVRLRDRSGASAGSIGQLENGVGLTPRFDRCSAMGPL